jgi:hypothetical protein
VALDKLYNYLINGGRLYIENPDLGYAHNGTPFWNLLGITYQGDGSSSGNVSALKGIEAWLGSAMAFDYPYGQSPDSYIDLWAPSGTGVGQLRDQMNRVKVISNVEAARGYRTIASAVIFGAFGENAPMSTQTRLMARYIAFLLGDDQVPPAQVAGLTASSDGSELTLAWEPVADDALGGHESTDSYVIERAVGIDGAWEWLALIPGTEFVDEPPCLGDPNENAIYSVRAIDTSGNTGEGSRAGEFDFTIEHP